MSDRVVTVVIPTHNRCEGLLRTLESLSQLRDPSGLEVVVVANACTDDTVSSLQPRSKDRAFPLHVVEEARPNLNVARNVGLRHASQDWIAFLDDDVWVEPGWVEGLGEAMEAGAGVAAGRVTLWWEAVERPTWFTERAERLLSWLDRGDRVVDLEPPGALVGANFAVHRRVFDEVGGFFEGLDRSGTELLSGGDTEFVVRARRLGHRVVYAPRMSVRHWVAPERTTISYLARVARGRGRTRIALLEALGQDVPAAEMRLARRRVWRGRLQEGWARLRGDRAAALDGRLIAERASGVLSALRESEKGL